MGSCCDPARPRSHRSSFSPDGEKENENDCAVVRRWSKETGRGRPISSGRGVQHALATRGSRATKSCGYDLRLRRIRAALTSYF